MKNVTLRRAIKLFTFASMTAWLGCDATTTPGDPGTPLFTVRGSVVSDGDVTPGHELRAMLLWTADPEFWEFGVAAQDIPVRSEFPSSFTMDVFDPPAEEAFQYSDDAPGGSWPAEARFATGVVVVYEDGNDNGAFDATPSGAAEYIDTVRAASSAGEGGIGVLYVEWSEPIDYDGIVLQPGFNLVLADDEEVVPPDTEIVLTVGDDPYVKTLACEGGVDFPLMGENVAPADAGAAFTEGFQCSEDGRFVDQQLECEFDPSDVCPEYVECPYLSSALAEGEVPPADWPCEP